MTFLHRARRVDRLNANRVRRRVQLAGDLYVLAFILLGLGLVIELVIRTAGVQNQFAAFALDAAHKSALRIRRVSGRRRRGRRVTRAGRLSRAGLRRLLRRRGGRVHVRIL